MQKKLGIALIGLLVCVGLLFVPIFHEYTIREGTDEFKAHHSLYGVREKSVGGTASAPIHAIGLILVNLRRAPSLAPVTVKVSTQHGGLVETQTLELPAVIDDEFTWFVFDGPTVSRGEGFVVSVSSPNASRDNAIGVRFDLETRELALSVREKIPVWERIYRWALEHKKNVSRTLQILKYSAALAGIFLLVEYLARRNRFIGISAGLLFLVACTLYLRVPLSNSLESAYGGDAFNYILKGNAWIIGEDPFAADPRKAPLYSFLTAPGLLPPFDPVLWARGISIISAVATVVLVCLFLLRSGAPLSIALGGGLLLSINRDYQFESVQGLSNTLYAALIFACTYAYLSQKKYMVSVYAALATLTRYEGAAVAGIMMPAMWVLYRSSWRKMIREALPFLILVAIPFSLTIVTGNVGVRTVSDITSDEGLYIAHSWDYFVPSIKAFKIFYGRLWFLSSSVGDVFGLFGIGACIGLIGSWMVKKYVFLRKFLVLIPMLIIYAFIYGSLFGQSPWSSFGEVKFFIGLLSLSTGFGVGSALLFRPKAYVPIILMVAVQIAVITAILPKNRYYLQILPFIAMAIAGGFWVLSGAKKATKVAHGFALVALCVIISTVYLFGDEALSGQVSDHNEKSASQTVITMAGKYLKTVPEKVAISEHIDIALRVYVPQDRFVSFPDRLDTIDEQYTKLRESGAGYVLQSSDHPYFAGLIAAHPEAFQEVATFTTRWADVSTTLYRIL